MKGTTSSPVRRWTRIFVGAVLLGQLAIVGAGAADIEGPITGGDFGRPFGTSSDVDPADFGYVEEEFFLSGEATTYGPAPGALLGSDGQWSVEETGAVPYRTRILVRRPVDPGRFNGTAIVFWMNTSAGFDISDFGSPQLMRRGYAHVFVSAQRQSVEGGNILGDPGTLGLKDWDPTRYGSLDVPSTDLSFGIFSQAARAVGPSRTVLPNDPMDGMVVERLIAVGGSQSAAWLATYYNAVQPIENPFDAFLIQLYFGSGNPLETGLEMPDRLRFREDGTAPVMVLNTENETLSYAPARQPDTDRFRLWEYAGLNHTGGVDGVARIDAYTEREFDFTFPVPNCGRTVDTIDSAPIAAAGLVAVDTWVRTGVPPASLPSIELIGDPAEVVRDDYGNAVGGIRIPPIAVPTATRVSPATERANIQCFLLGYEIPFTDDELRHLYRSRAAYVSRVRQAARDAQRLGVLLPEDAAVYRNGASRDPVARLLGCPARVRGRVAPDTRSLQSACAAAARRPLVRRR